MMLGRSGCVSGRFLGWVLLVSRHPASYVARRVLRRLLNVFRVGCRFHAHSVAQCFYFVRFLSFFLLLFAL